KPTFGLVSRFGQLPSTSATTDHLGPLTKDVMDAAILLNALAGPDLADPTSIPSVHRNYTEGITDGIAGLRIGIPRNFFFEQANDQVKRLVTEAIKQLESLGADITEVDLPAL